jgi:hypothetical protein
MRLATAESLPWLWLYSPDFSAFPAFPEKLRDVIQVKNDG